MSLDGKKVYFPVESLVGLGHFNRTGKIVQEMVKAGMETTVASGTFVDRERFFAGATCTELPPNVFNSNGRHFTLDADGKRTIIPDFNENAHRQARVDAHIKNVAALKPDVLVSEFWPFDRPQFDGEMAALIAGTAESKLQKKCTRLVSVRDVLNAKDDKSEEAEAQKQAHDGWAARTINRDFDAVLVHGDPRFVTLRDTFKAADDIKKEIIYTGYVINDLPKRVAPDAINGPLLVSCGSGASAHDMIFSFMGAWRKLIERSEADAQAMFVTKRPVHIVCGPRFFNQYYDEVVEWAKILQEKSGQEIKVEKYRSDLTSLMATAAFSVSLAGYNTTLEMLAIGTPGLFVPHYVLNEGKANVNAEQLYRLNRLEQQKLATFITPEDAENSRLFADRLVHEIIRQTMDGTHTPCKLDFTGAETTIKAVERLVRKTSITMA